MPEQDPGWFYIGNGQLQYKDQDGWTDQFQDLDGPKKVAAAEASEAPDTPKPSRGKAKKATKEKKVGKAQKKEKIDRGPRARPLLILIKGGAGTARRSMSGLHSVVVSGWGLVATGYQEGSAAASRRAIARRPRHRESSSALPDVRSLFPQASAGQSGRRTGREEATVTVTCDKCGETLGDVGSSCRACGSPSLPS